MEDLMISTGSIKDKIHYLRGVQFIMDKDIAALYNIETRVLKQAVNRNRRRFPPDFMFVMTAKEIEFMVSQGVIPSRKYLGGALPYAFTEQGVANLAGILASDKAIEINIQIMRAFISMRKILASGALTLQRLDKVEQRQLEYDKKFEQIFDAIESKDVKLDKGIFYDGQVFDAYELVVQIIKSAKQSIILIDNYIDETVLVLFSKRKKDVKVTIYTKITEELSLDLKKYNAQYPNISVHRFNKSHDRFMIVDDAVVYHFGASLKDLGKKWFAFSKFEKDAVRMLMEL
ncbi:MAG: ORF6N domain-containing protein [Candidatus Woesearchaeota archaeon]